MEMNFAKNIAYVACFPRNGWVEVSRDGVQARQVQARVLYPMMAVVALSAFMALLYNEEATLTGCIQSAIIEFAKYFFTYLLASYVLTGYFPAVVKDRQSADRANVVIQYCMAIIIALNIIDNLLPVAFPYLRILYCYIFFVAWKADAYLGIKEEGDKKFLSLLAARGVLFSDSEEGLLADGRNVTSFRGFEEDMRDYSDQALTVAALAPFADSPTRLTGLKHIRRQECDRLHAIAHNLSTLGVPVREEEDGVVITPAPVRGGTVETFGDHRVAMAFSLIGLKTGNIAIENPSCCKKTFDNYFQLLDELTS